MLGSSTCIWRHHVMVAQPIASVTKTSRSCAADVCGGGRSPLRAELAAEPFGLIGAKQP